MLRAALSEPDRREVEITPAARPAHPVLQLQRAIGNAAVARAVLARRSAEDKQRFMAWRYGGPFWRPTTHFGQFDADYDPKTGILDITVKCKFRFKAGKAEDFEDSEDESPQWTREEKDHWKRQYLAIVSHAWSDKFTFYCTRPGWEDLRAAVKVSFVEVKKDKDAHWVVHVNKNPEVGDFHQSKVRPPKLGVFGHGHAFLNSEDLASTEKVHGFQVPAVHEAGHMLGLDDEYSKDTKKPIAHAKLVKEEYGVDIKRRRDDRLMSDGDRMEDYYGVTFLEALRGITGVEEWHHKR